MRCASSLLLCVADRARYASRSCVLLSVAVGLVVELDDDVVLVAVVGHDIEDVVVVVVDSEVDDDKFCEMFDLGVLFPPSVRGVSSCVMLIVVESTSTQSDVDSLSVDVEVVEVSILVELFPLLSLTLMLV